MKITGGKFKGRKIESRSDRSVRPTTGKVREAIFNILRHGKFLFSGDFISDGGDTIEGRRVVDIFCGTGALGLEALSRGAAHVTLIDQDAKVVEVIRHNIEHLGDTARVGVVRSDSTKLPRAHHPCMLAFLDPPYYSGLSVAALKSLAVQGWLAYSALVIVEQSSKDPFELPENFRMLDDRDYNKTRILVLQYTGGKL